MRASRREAAGLVCAILAHAVAIGWLTRAPVHDAAAVVAPSAPSAPVDIDVDLGPEPAQPLALATGAVAPSAPRMLAAARAISTAARELPAPPDGAPAAPPPSEAPLDLSAPLALSADAIGLGGRNVFLGAVPDGTATPAATSDAPEANVAPGAQQSLRDALHEHDHAIGLDVGGPVIAVAEALTRPSDTPVNSRAVFEVTADASGDVIGVSLVDVSEGRGEWERVAASLGNALRSRKLRVPAGTGGVTITIEVTSRWQLPSGHDPDTEVSVLGIPVKKVPKTSKRPQKVEILKPELKIVEAPTPPEASPVVKLPQYQVQVVKLLGIDVDPTDLAPRPLRVVHARVVHEKLL